MLEMLTNAKEPQKAWKGLKAHTSSSKISKNLNKTFNPKISKTKKLAKNFIHITKPFALITRA